MTKSEDGWLNSTDWREPPAVGRNLNNVLTAWVGFAELAATDPDGPDADQDRAEAERARRMFLRAVERSVLAGGLPTGFGSLLAEAESAEQAAAWLRPFDMAVLGRRALAHQHGEHAARILVAQQHSEAMIAALGRNANRTELLVLVAAAWADGLLSPEDADALTGPDASEAHRRAALLGVRWR